MKTETNTKETYLGLAGMIGLILVIIFASTLTPGTFFQGQTSLRPASGNCDSLTLKSIPAPLKAGGSAVIIAQTSPETWEGVLRFSATEGIMKDSLGNEGSLVETTEKIIDYSGGSDGDIITVQADGPDNESCLATIVIEASSETPCESLSVITDSETILANQSARFTINTVPADFNGELVIRADSGTLQTASLKGETKGENTPLMVTTARTFYYGGGRAGEKIHIDALGADNTACKETLEIAAQ